jgi:hypothetical protein
VARKPVASNLREAGKQFKGRAKQSWELEYITN